MFDIENQEIEIYNYNYTNRIKKVVKKSIKTCINLFLKNLF